MNAGEWTQVFNYLLQKLDSREADSSLITEIRLASTIRTEDTSPLRTEIIEQRKKMRISNADFETRTFRALTPNEVFRTSLQVLVTRLREVPALSQRLQELLEKEPSEIHWSPDAAETEYKAPQESFTASAITLSNDEKANIDAALKLIENLLQNE